MRPSRRATRPASPRSASRATPRCSSRRSSASAGLKLVPDVVLGDGRSNLADVLLAKMATGRHAQTADRSIDVPAPPSCRAVTATRSGGYGISISAQYLLIVVMTSANWPERDGLQEVARDVELERFDAVTLFVRGREHDDRDGLQLRIGADLAQKLDAVHLRHVDVEQDQAGASAAALPCAGPRAPRCRCCATKSGFVMFAFGTHASPS